MYLFYNYNEGDNLIVIVRGIHPLEVSARYTAEKVSEELTRRGHATHLFTIPFETTHFAHALGSTSEYAETRDLLENAGFDPSKTFYYDFHNYKLPDDFGQHRQNSRMFQFNALTSSEKFKKRFGCIGYEFKGLDEDEGWCEGWYDDGLYGEGYEVVNSVLYEIPAFYRRLPEKILKKLGGRYVAESSGIYDDLVVDFRKTKEAGFLDKRVVIRSIVKHVLRTHERFPTPLKRRF